MPRRQAPTPLRLHAGPTPPRNFPKFTLPLIPQQAFYPAASPPRSKADTQNTSEELSSPAISGIGLSRIPVLPKEMTRGPSDRSSLLGGQGIVMPSFSPISGRVIAKMGPWDHSKLSLSVDDVEAMIAAPKRAVANPCPIVW